MKILLVTTLFFFTIFTTCFAEGGRAFDEVDCVGKCGRFIDSNNDNYCDYGELSSGSTVGENTGSGLSGDFTGGELSVAQKYKFWEVSIVTIFIYIISFVLQKKKKITLLTHRRIWNSVLLLTFLISGILGVFLALGLYFSMIKLHVLFGLIMFWVTLFHIFERWRFFKNMFSRK